MRHLAPLLLALSACATLQPVTPEAIRTGAPWLELKTAHLVVHTNVQAQVAERMAKQLERNRRALLLLWGPNVDPPGELRVVVLKSKEQMKHFAGEVAGAFFTVGPAGPLLVLAADGGYLLGDGEGEEYLQVHELAHAVMYGVIPRQSRWLAEGLATYLENVRVDEENNVALGKVNLRALGHVRSGGRVPLATLRAWSGFRLSHSDSYDRYATAWAWVHFLFNERPQQFVQYLQRVANGESDEIAWRASFSEAERDQEQALTVYLASGHSGYTTVPLPAVPQDVATAALPAGAMHATLAHLYLVGPHPRSVEERRTLARAELEAASRHDPELRLTTILSAMVEGQPLHAEAGVTPASVNAPACPADIPRDNVIEHESVPPPGTRVPVFDETVLLTEENNRPRSSVIELSGGSVGLFAVAKGGAKAVLLRQEAPGACILTTWGVSLAGESSLGPIQTWISQDRKHAVFVLQLQTAGAEGTETRWVTVATDGKRAWAPLKGGASAQLLAREAKLRPQSGKLYLDVKVKGPAATVFAFRPESGNFEPLR